ncbi:hypothetical protein K435DRAFT_962870 [Dendrothele bispora CBS 962.96]|uniref:Uncharacterized protein n=1 Tax=Dendrothele bispora (strain CBS 962.96) TaxID=1314807 RepID=A0A4S8MIY1_DENBC|nr:hypothetical protein K435DRAFT_962870 [Dendrothele bispora CBS 962.96]
MSNKPRPENTVICFKGKKVYVHLKESKKKSVETAIEVFKSIGVSGLPQPADANLYVIIEGHKVFFGCESGCDKSEDNQRCVDSCCWVTMKPSSRMVYLESKVEVKHWHIRLPYRIGSTFVVFKQTMSNLMCICCNQKPEGDEADTDNAEYRINGNNPAGGESTTDAANQTELAGQTGSVDQPKPAGN